jgi:AcrR family transcriptional regulator
MTRPSNDLDERLLRAGRAIVAARGFGALTVRAAAGRARVNPGMFHYHFRTMRLFKRRLLQDIYEDFFKDFTLATQGAAPRERLVAALRFLGRFVRDHRDLGLRLVEDALRGDPETIDFLSTNFGRHLSVILDLLRRGQSQGSFRPWAPPLALLTLASAVGVPSLVLAGLKRAGTRRAYGEPLDALERVVLSDEAIDRRVDALVDMMTVHA